MLTLFTTAKPFVGHSAIIQRNALRSWTQLHPDAEVILFGDDPGAQEIAAQLNIRHEPYVQRNSFGSKRLDFMFNRAQEIARHDVLCYLNCDIILTHDFPEALAQLRSRTNPFLMVGRRWDTDINQPLDFTSAEWAAAVRREAQLADNQRPAWWIDYFAFSRGLFLQNIPPLVIGRVFWDNWLLWKAGDLDADVIDASAVVMAIHQNHDYGYHPKGQSGVWNDEQSLQNFRLTGGHLHLRTMESAQFFLTPQGLRPNPFARFTYLRMTARRVLKPAYPLSLLQKWFWHPFLRLTRPVRQKLGFRQGTAPTDPRPKV